jgi:hypothetical protein
MEDASLPLWDIIEIARFDWVGASADRTRLTWSPR